jgi:hypothetical protein
VEPIALFDSSRTQPRIQTATRALEKGDYQFAGEIVGELEAEGNIDPQISLLRAQIDQVTRQKTVAQLLESARARYEEEEDPLALQKIQEVLQLDSTNVTALALKSRIAAASARSRSGFSWPASTSITIRSGMPARRCRTRSHSDRRTRARRDYSRRSRLQKTITYASAARRRRYTRRR